MKESERFSICFTPYDDTTQSVKSGAKANACTTDSEFNTYKIECDVLFSTCINLNRSTKLKVASHINMSLRHNDRSLSGAVINKGTLEDRYTNCYSTGRGLE